MKTKNKQRCIGEMTDVERADFREFWEAFEAYLKQRLFLSGRYEKIKKRGLAGSIRPNVRRWMDRHFGK